MTFEPTALTVFALRLTCGVTAAWLAAATTAFLLRRRSAALRHRVWSLSVIITLLLPALVAFVPEWRVGNVRISTQPPSPTVAIAIKHNPVAAPPPPPRSTPNQPAPTATPTPTVTEKQPRPAPPVTASAQPPSTVTQAAAPPLPVRNWTPWLTTLWLIPALWLLLRQIHAIRAARRLVSRSTPPSDAAVGCLSALANRLSLRRPPRVLESNQIPSPLCLGLLHPAILLPTTSRAWPAAQLDAVLTHELAHVVRRDVLWQTLARLACALYWFHPLAWFAAARMRTERELACDDWVLRAGNPSTDYARWLLDVAAALAARPTRIAPCAGIAMASRPGLEHRILAILDPARRRLPVSRRTAVLTALAAALLLIAAGTLSPLAPRRAIAQDVKPDAGLPPVKILKLDVVDPATNRPLANVKLSATVDRQQRVWLTDDAGRAPLDLPANLRAVTVRAEKDGYVPTKVSWAPVQTEESLPDEYLLKLEPGNTIGGIVADEAGKPVANVDIDLYLFRKGEPDTARGYPTGEQVALFDVKTRTDDRGRWQYPLAPRDLIRPMFRLAHPDYVADEWFRPAPADTASPEKLRQQTSVLPITRGVRITGRVLDDRGQGVPSARVNLGKTQHGYKSPPRTVAGPDGRFELPHCRPGQRADLLVTAPGRAPTLKQFQLDKDTTDLAIPTEPARRLAVRVVDPAGKPLAGARLAAAQWRGTELLDWSAQTDADGRLTWPDAPADPVTYSLQLRGYIEQPDQVLTAGDAEHTLTLLPELTLRGTVIDDETGKPVDNFRVIRGAFWPGRTTPAWARTEPEIKTQPGKFELKETKEQTAYAVVVEALGYRPAESRPIKPGESTVDLEFRLKKGPDLAATILAPDGKPLASADVLFATSSGQILVDNGVVDDVSTYCPRTRTDAAGGFRAPAQAGELRILIVHPAAFLILKPEDLADHPTITAPAWARIEGTARIGTTPVTGAEIEAFTDASSQPRDIFSSVIPRATATVDAQGRYVLDRVQAGKVYVGIKPKSDKARPAYYSGPALRRTIDVLPSQTARLDLGGAGHPVTGRFVLPPAAADRADPYYAHAQLIMKAPRDDDYHFLSPVARDGTFRFDDVPPGQYEFSATYLTPAKNRAHAPGPPLAAIRKILTITDQPLELGNVQLDPPADPERAAKPVPAAGAPAAQDAPRKADPDVPDFKVISFRVVETGTNRPVDQVKLSARVTGQRRSWMTDDDGHARIDVDADPQSLTVWADKDGYVPMTVTWEPSRSHEPIPDEYLLPLERGTTIGGTITNDAGKPIPAVDVALALERKGEEQQGGGLPLGPRVAIYDVHVKADGTGRWKYDRAPAQIQSPRLRLTHPDYLSDEGFGQRPVPPEEKLRDQTSVIVMTRGVTVAGRVLDPDGSPVAAARLALGLTRYGNHAPTATSDADGRFTLRNCRPGQHATLIVTTKNWAPYMSQFQLDKPIPDLEVKLEPGRTLRLRIVDKSGQPVPGASVSAGRWRGMDVLDWRGNVDADGRVAWPQAPADEIQINAGARGFIYAYDKRFTAGDTERVITLAPLLNVAGTVVDAETGKPIEKFNAIRGWTSGGRRPEAPHWSRDEGGVKQTPGAFAYTESSDRDGYALRIEAPGYLPAESRIIKPGESDVKLDFRLRKGKDVAATLKSVDGKPLAGADILFANESSQIFIKNGKPSSGTYTLQTKADASGHFRFEPQTGKYSILVVHDLGYAELTPDQFTADVPPTITVQPWATLRGTARIGANPATGRTIVAMSDRSGRVSRECSATVDAQGHFVLDRVPPGKLFVGLEVRMHEDSQGTTITWTQRQNLEAQAGKTIEISIGGTGRPVIGRLVAPPELAAKADWHLADASIYSQPAIKRQFPPDWDKLSPEAQQKLTNEWLKTPEGQAAMKEEANRRWYPFPVNPSDATFRADDIPPGNYQFSARLGKPVSMGGSRYATGAPAASATLEFTIPNLPTGRSDQPLDLGAIELKPIQPVQK